MHKMIFRVSTVLIAFMVLTVGLLVTVSPSHTAVAADNNGTRDKNEDGFTGVTVTLHDKNGKQVASTTTDHTGRYTFTGLTHGEYTVHVKRGSDSVPIGEVSTYAWQNNAGNDESTIINSQIGAQYENINFGYPIAKRTLSSLPVSGDVGMIGALVIVAGLILAGVVITLKPNKK